MCTEKQIEYVQKLAKWKSQKVDIEQVRALSDNQVSAMIDEMKKLPSMRKADKPDTDIQHPAKRERLAGVQWNAVRLGLVIKIDAQQRIAIGMDLLPSGGAGVDAYLARIRDLYELYSAAEESVRGACETRTEVQHKPEAFPC